MANDRHRCQLRGNRGWPAHPRGAGAADLDQLSRTEK